MGLSIHPRRGLVIAGIMIVLGCASRPLVSRVAPELKAEPHGLPLTVRCAVRCSTSLPRRPVASITWSAGPEAGGRTVVAERCDVTVYKDGFEQGRYVTLAPIAAERSFVPPPGQRAAPDLPAALRLRVIEVRRPRGGADEPSSGNTTLEVEGLEPGINYFWRLSGHVGDEAATSEVVRCQAPTCPTDYQPGEKP